jgi:hypothetical protein
MGSGLPGLERQAYGGTASKIWMTEEIAVEKAQNIGNRPQYAYFLSKTGIDRFFESLCPTGC